MPYSPGANFSVSIVSLLQCSNFYAQNFLEQPSHQSFKEPQLLTFKIIDNQSDFAGDVIVSAMLPRFHNAE
jgi:hypothetical protein